MAWYILFSKRTFFKMRVFLCTFFSGTFFVHFWDTLFLVSFLFLVRDEDVSINKANRCFSTAMLFKPQDWHSTGHGSHTPVQDGGGEPMMDLTPSLQTWYEHTVALICAQRPSVNTGTETQTETGSETEIETETDSCQC